MENKNNLNVEKEATSKELTREELVDRTAKEVLEKYRKAFEELAK